MTSGGNGAPRDRALAEFTKEKAAELGIVGAAVGVVEDGRAATACHGMTSLDNPVPVDPRTLFIVGSVTKTFTATAIMCLVAGGRLQLDAPVRRYVPELILADEQAASEITVLNLLNHTSGLDWGLIDDFGEGDDAVARYVARLRQLDQLAAPGTRASYSQAGYNLLGRIVEHVTGVSYERAVASLLLDPLALSETFFARDDIMTRRFAVGHNLGDDGTPAIARLWRRSRGDNPGGGLASSIGDLLRWARFHVEHHQSPEGEKVAPAALLRQMREPTVELRGSALGDAIGIGWFLRELEGLLLAGHGGSANGQFAELLTVPERHFAVVSLNNSGPDGIRFNQAVIRWALESYLGLIDHDPQPIPVDPETARELAGRYENEAQTLVIAAAETGLTLAVDIKREIRAAANKALPPGYPPAGIGLLAGGQDEYIITEGGLRGQRGFLTRGPNGNVLGVDLAGRLFNRIDVPPS